MPRSFAADLLFPSSSSAMVRSIHSWSRPVGVHTLFYYLTFKNWSSLFDYYVLQFVKNLNGNHNFTHFSIYSIQCLIFSLVAKIRDQNEIKFVQDGCCILSGLFSCVDWTRFFFVVEKLRSFIYKWKPFFDG